MERRANPPPPPPPSIPIHTISADPNQTAAAAASSSSSPSISPPDFLRQFHAVFKRHRPIGTMQSNVSRASRVLVSHPESSKSTTTTKSSTTGNKVGKRPSQAGAPVGAARLPNVVLDRRKDRVAEVATNPPEDSSLTPPFTGTITTVGSENMSPFGMQKGDAELVHNRNEVPLQVPSSTLPLNGNSSLDFQSSDARLTTDTRRDNISSYMRSLALTEGEGYLGSRPAMNGNDVNQGYLRTMEMSDSGMKFDEGASLLEKRGELGHIKLRVDPVARSSVVGSSCATTISVHSGPTYHCTHAPLAGQTASATQMSSSAAESSLDVQDHALPEGRGTVQKEGDGIQDNQQAPRMGEVVKEKGVSRDANGLRAQDTMMNNPASNVGLEPFQSSKAEKVPRKKKYDPDIFFKVNGKLYQKLGKIGSGGSSEVHKVISSDCTIYALKKIKLKGRDYPTAYGFCQEIEYLNRLKRRNNIIQLIDYEVTDKKLLEGGMNGSMSTKDGRIKDDQYIYMVLEYGEIDLAHMLSHKWMKMDSSSWKIDENWLRFYWQQMLEAVNTIHEERIVHSDLKPANFLLVRGSLKLIDFGIAKAILCDTTNIQRDAQVGTLNYMSPEAFMWNEQDASGNTIKCGRPSDIWSLGCILYQMVYGKTPFAEYKTFWAKFKVITDRKHEIAYEHVSNPWLIDLMRRCLAWDRNERWRIPQLLQHPFLVPPIPRELCDFGRHPCESLMQRVGAYWDDPQVSRLCSELHEVVADLERRKDDPASAD